MKWTTPLALACLLTAGVSACGGEPGPEPALPPGPAPPDTAEPAATEAPDAPPATPGTPLPVPTEGDPANHYLDGETLFTATAPFQHNFIYAHPAKQLAPPGADGKAKFWDFHTKKEFATKHFWKSRAAKPDELAVGPLALIAHKKNSEGVYVAPGSVKEAYEVRWWITRIVSVRPKAEGYVLLSGSYRAAPDAIRFLEGDTSPRITKQGKEDAHFLAEEHWFVGNAPLPDKSFLYLDPAVPAKPDKPLEGGEGRFVATNSGKVVLTAHAWQTRKATRADLKKGKLVVAPHVKEGKIYRAPKTRAEALGNRWWAVKIADTKKLGTGIVGLEGGYEVKTDGLRIIK